ncbi:acyl-CoA dehydrogenase family protein [Shouchella shacheensis]|uniref:acyl-CoA dehydrogenase family protein n=1 Tax=Shouchella shacheensis TaxID=1649580 RepID=UPI0007404F52|nr:acyl-CoA dehydrogenase family protein [Shouchella shacheensis]
MAQTDTRRAGGLFFTESPELGRVFTPEAFTEEHQMIAETARQFVHRDVQPYQESIEKQDFEKTVSLLQKAGGLGLLGHSIPEAYGGLGLDKISKAVVGEVLGGTGSYGVAHSNHTCIATLPITYYGTAEQKSAYLPKLASGEFLGAYCLTEPNAGSDALAAQTTAKLSADKKHYVLNGSKIYITNAVFADTFIVYAKVDGEHFTAFIVEKDYPRLSLGPEEKKMGIKGSSTRTVVMEDCLVPVENVLGEVGRGHIIAFNVLNLGRFNLGSACMGGAKGGFGRTLSFIQERKQFKTRIADFSATKEKVGRMAARLYAAESIQYRVAGQLEEVLGELYDERDFQTVSKGLAEYAIECAICKVFGSETLDEVADESLQLHGGAGFIEEYGMERMYRDSRINRIFEGTNEINRLLIPTHLFRKAAKNEIDLKAVAEDAVAELANPARKEGLLSEERAAVEVIRKLFLACAGLAYKAYGTKLKGEQEVLIRLADLAIELFAVESVVLRTYKAALADGEEAHALKLDLTRSYLERAIWRTEQLARSLVLAVANEEEKRAFSQVIIRACSAPLAWSAGFERNRSIAEAQYKAERYQC